VRGRAEPLGRALARTGLSPNALTLIGLGVAVVAAIAAGAGAWLLAGLLVIFGGVFDMFDGLVARATGKASKAGAFLDSTFDRWGEGVVYVGIVRLPVRRVRPRGPHGGGDDLGVHGQLRPSPLRGLGFARVGIPSVGLAP
jgi:hypothetical protein